MMKAVFDMDVHYAFTSQPEDPEDYYCDELIVGWGARRRLGNPAVALRAGRAVAAIYGESDAIEAFVAEQSGTETPMAPGVDFCTNLEGGATSRSRAASGGCARRASRCPTRCATRSSSGAAGRASFAERAGIGPGVRAVPQARPISPRTCSAAARPSAGSA